MNFEPNLRCESTPVETNYGKLEDFGGLEATLVNWLIR